MAAAVEVAQTRLSSLDEDQSHFDNSTAISAIRTAQREWRETSVKERLRIVRRFRQNLATSGTHLAGLVSSSLHRPPADTLISEVIPLAEAAAYLELRAESLLQRSALPTKGRPHWLSRVEIEVRREPHGIVLIIAPSNYPLFLPGVQTLQALTAGNAVVWKPGAGGQALGEEVKSMLDRSGLPPHLLSVTGEDSEEAQRWIREGVDKVVLTGSARSGQSVLEQCARRTTPATVELSGCDAMFVLSGANVSRAAAALVFGLTMNGGATCIAPRRIFVDESVAPNFREQVALRMRDLSPVNIGEPRAKQAAVLLDDALAKGASSLLPLEPVGTSSMRPVVLANASPSMEIMRADIFAPIAAMVTVLSVQSAIEIANACPYALGASIFGDAGAARRLAGHIDAGVVVINDVIVPTADPRLPFGGRKASGFGTTRGSEGLLEMTVLKSVAVQGARRLRHLEPAHPRATSLFENYLKLKHAGGLRNRVHAAAALIRAVATGTPAATKEQ